MAMTREQYMLLHQMYLMLCDDTDKMLTSMNLDDDAIDAREDLLKMADAVLTQYELENKMYEGEPETYED